MQDSPSSYYEYWLEKEGSTSISGFDKKENTSFDTSNTIENGGDETPWMESERVFYPSQIDFIESWNERLYYADNKAKPIPGKFFEWEAEWELMKEYEAQYSRLKKEYNEKCEELDSTKKALYTAYSLIPPFWSHLSAPEWTTSV